MKQESILQKQVCGYINAQYPKALFVSDLSGIRLTIGQAVALKYIRKLRAWPDLFIPEPNQIYHGLFIELKADGVKLKKIDGDYVNEHIKEQADVLAMLNERGYHAVFAVGFDEAKSKIDEYFAL
jgi:hypothetical protein